MGLKKAVRIDEGPFDFVRGASAAAGSKIANSAPVQAVKRNVSDVVQAGKQASAQGDLTKAVQQFAKLLVKYEKLKGTAPQREEPTMDQQPEQQQQQAAPKQQAPQRHATPDAFRTTTKARGRMGQHGFEYTFDSFLQDLSGEKLDEGVWDFVKGAGAAVAGKVRDKINAYAEQPSVLKDIYHAGKQASAEGNARKATQQLQNVEAETKQALKRVVVMVKQMGDNGQKALGQAGKALPPQLQQRVVRLVLANLK